MSSFLTHKSIKVSNYRRKRFAFITAALITAAVAGGAAAAGVGISLAVANKRKENSYHYLI